MQDAPSLSPVLPYESLPLWIALGLFCFALVIGGTIWWVTRKKPQKVLNTLPPAPTPNIDTTTLKQTYLQKIELVETAYRAHELLARAAHQELSRLLKAFVSEAEHMPVKTMTLTELKKTRHASLATVIETYYRPEFAAVESGSVDAALSAARQVVQGWS